MPDIKDSVGDGGTNAVHDVAMVQLILRVVKDAKNTPYFGADYTGAYNDAVKNAIIAFQKDQKLLPAAVPAAGAKVAGVAEKQGLIVKNSQTLAKLNALLPAKYATATIIEGTKTIYLAMDEATAKASSNTIIGKASLDLPFRTNVAALVTQVFQQHKLALTIPAGSGWDRDFAEQAKIPPAKTGAGPGESNHNYGKAVDIGFNRLQWVKGDGEFGRVDFWLEGGGMPANKQEPFWKARNTIAAGLNLFPTFFPGDLIHLQAFQDAHVGYANSLAALLNAVTVKLKWQAVPGHPNHYKNDMGLGGAKFLVGTARQIWAGNAQVVKADLVAALNAKLAMDKKFNVFAFFGLPPDPKAAPPPPPLKEADIKDAYLAKIKADLKADFVAADANRGKWNPLP